VQPRMELAVLGVMCLQQDRKGKGFFVLKLRW
jgi:hypothetical protein